jgi:uncharacterized membrane protein
MKNLLVTTMGAVPILVPVVSFAQSGNMMNGGGWMGGWMGGYGGYGEIWMPLLLVIVVVALVVWIVKQKK